jgi:HEAT repeat protein
MRSFVITLIVCSTAYAQDTSSPDAKERARAARQLIEQGSPAIPKLEALLKDPVLDVRLEAVKAIVEIGTQHSLDPLIAATRDPDPEIQIRATDGLVNFYLPGYVRTGLTASLRRAGSSVRGRLTDTNDQVVDHYIQVRPEVIAALGRLVTGGISMESRANAARALGILRGGSALPELIQALRSKDDVVLYESLVAIQKIRDPEAAPRIAFLLRDLNERVQIAAIETTGILGNKEALPQLRDAVQNARTDKIRRAALTAIAMIPDTGNRPLFQQYFASRDDHLRAAAAEGYGRLKNTADMAMLDAAFNNERDRNPRLSLAFALVNLGRHETTEFSPLRYLVDSLNSRSWRGVAFAFLVELAREPIVRQALLPMLRAGTRDEKTHLAQVLGRSGGEESVDVLNKLMNDPDAEVAEEAVRSLRILRARVAQK